MQEFKEIGADLNPSFPTGGVSSIIVLSKNERFAAYTKTNYQGLQALLEPGKWYESPEAMGFPMNDRVQSLRKIWDDQSDLALRLHFLPDFFFCLFVFLVFGLNVIFWLMKS